MAAQVHGLTVRKDIKNTGALFRAQSYHWKILKVMFNCHVPATLTAVFPCLPATTLRLQPWCLYTYTIFFYCISISVKNIECHVYISHDAPCFPATSYSGNSMLESRIIPLKDIESHVQFPCVATLTAAVQCLARTTLRLQPLCLYILYSLSHKHGWWDGDDRKKVGWWWGGLVMGWVGDMGCRRRDGMGSGWWWGCLLLIIYVL